MTIDRAGSIPTGSIPTGSTVEVWNRSLGRWGGQFEVTASTPAGVQVRRPAEDAPLPETFTVDEVRPVINRPSAL